MGHDGSRTFIPEWTFARDDCIAARLLVQATIPNLKVSAFTLASLSSRNESDIPKKKVPLCSVPVCRRQRFQSGNKPAHPAAVAAEARVLGRAGLCRPGRRTPVDPSPLS